MKKPSELTANEWGLVTWYFQSYVMRFLGMTGYAPISLEKRRELWKAARISAFDTHNNRFNYV